MPDPVAYLVLVLACAVLALLIPFAGHRTWLLVLSGRRTPTPPHREWVGPLPRVTVQLPVFNEAGVVERLVDAAASLDYPSDLLQIQVLDDSTDETTRIAAAAVGRWRRRGIDVVHLRRTDREGFKAGALAAGLGRANGELLLVLDADFVPAPDLVRRLMAPFRDPGVGMVQARWDHLNEEAGWLTRAQALLLDGHFFYEQGGRYAAGRFFNFNGTAGMWRRACLEDAGGWEADTLTEDLDLSYRAQMKGWRFVFLGDVGVPAELPERVSALEVQQKRWAQGGIQTARKILPSLLRGPWPLPVKLEAVVHLCGHLAHPLTLLLGLLIYPAALARRSLGWEEYLALDLVVFLAATVPFVVFYSMAGRRRDRPWRRLLPAVAATLAVGIGLSAPVTRAVLRGLRATADPFVRTPKRGGGPGSRYGHRSAPGDTCLKLALAVVLTASLTGALLEGFYASVPFLVLFASGYWGLGVGGLTAPRTPPRVDGEEAYEGTPEHQARPGGLGPLPGLLVGAEAPVSHERRAAQDEPGNAAAQGREGENPEDVPGVDRRRDQESRSEDPEERPLGIEAAYRGEEDDPQDHDAGGQAGRPGAGEEGFEEGEDAFVGPPVLGVG